MDEIEAVVEAPVVTGQSMGMALTVHRRMRLCRNQARGRILKCEMPKKCPEAFPCSAEKRIVTVYVHDKRTVWLLLQDVNWAIQYMYCQNVLKGVAQVPGDSAGPATP